MSSRIRWFAWMLVLARPVAALDIEDTRHLLDRTGFGARPEALEVFSPLDRAAAIERVLGATAASPPVPEWVEDRPLPDPRRLEGLTPEEREALRRAENRERSERLLALKAWWARSLLASDAPLVERVTLFWHNHFTSEARTVRSPPLMLRQHLEWRRHALGNYAELLRAVATDPAMLIYLDGRRNHKSRPNENFARELLEPFTLGEGHYGEADGRLRRVHSGVLTFAMLGIRDIRGLPSHTFAGDEGQLPSSLFK